MIDLGCGWGALGMTLALHARRLRIVGVDLDEGLLTLGRRVAKQAGLQRRVQLRGGDALLMDAWGVGSATIVVCQALLVHVPRAARFLADLIAALPHGARIGVVETDVVEAARAVRDSVTDRDPEYAALREEVARARSAGGMRTLGVDLRLGHDLDGVLEEAGLRRVGGVTLGEGSRLKDPVAWDSPRRRWFAARLERRLDQADDLVERSLAEAGGLAPARYERWLALRDAADRERLRALRSGQYLREDGWAARAAWGIKAG